MPELKEMSQFFGEQCMERGLTHSVRDTFYNEERKSFAECQMQKHDKLSFKEEIKTYVRLTMNSTETRTLEDVVEKMSAAPARLYGISRRGYIRQHYMADLVVVNPDDDYVISNDDVISPCGWTPYEGMRLRFRVEQTWVNGEPAYVNGSFTGLQTPLAIRFDA